jgi:hypothetical protein
MSYDLACRVVTDNWFQIGQELYNPYHVVQGESVYPRYILLCVAT